MKRLCVYLIALLLFCSPLVLRPNAVLAASLMKPLAQTVTGDMISPRSDLSQCLTVDGTDPSTAPGIILDTCRGTPQQSWTYDESGSQWQTELDTDYCLATVNATPTAGAFLTVRLCTDSRAFALEPNPTLADSYRVVGTALVLDWGVFGHVALASQNGFTFQFFRWLAPDLAIINTQGCAITYPIPNTDTATYDRELACDHVANLQPPYVVPAAAQRDASIFPGVVTPGASLVTNRDFTFDLQFQNNSYARMSTTPRNWKSTGLYAPADQIVDVTVSNATAEELSRVYVQIGVHTDVLRPNSPNVSGGKHAYLRYPNVVTKVRLQPGLNQVRSPYGGLIVFVSEASVNKTIDIQIDNVIEAPFFVLGQTSEAEWLARRTAAAPWGEIEGELAVLSVDSNQLSVLSYAEVSELAQFFSDVARYHNELSGMGANEPLPHTFPQGQQRFVTDKQITAGSAHAGYPTMFYDSYRLGTPSDTTLRSTDTDFGMFHEFGHNYQMGAWSNVYGVETTVNLFSLHAQELFFGTNRLEYQNFYASSIDLLNNVAIPDKWTAAGAFQKLVFLDQIRLGFPSLDWGIWQQIMRRYREMTSAEYSALNTDQLRYDKLMTIACDVTNTNLTPHFEIWTVPVSQAAKDECATKSALTEDIWLIDNAKPLSYHPGTGEGSFLREYWTGINGSQVSDLTSNPAYPNNPTGSSLMTTELEGIQNFGDNYGERLRGYISPPVTGDYRFWLAGDQTAQLLLSTDEDPNNAVLLIDLTTNTGYRNFDAQLLTVQRSVAVTLQAGQRYYIEVLHKESTGVDSVSVAWNVPATPGLPGEVRKIIDAQYLSPYSDAPENIAPTITSANNANVVENQTSAIDVQATDDNDSEGAGLTFSLSVGADLSLFNIDANTGVVTFINAPDFEAPEDAGGDNNYDIQVTVTDSGGLTDVQDIVITVTDEVEQIVCEPGSYLANLGDTSCTLADPGFFVSAAGATEQTPCSIGTFSAEGGATACTPAEIGFYVEVEGASSQTQCPVGTTTESTGSTSIDACIPTSTVFATCGGYDLFETAPGVYVAPGFSGTLIVGTNGNDKLTGTNGPDLIVGLGGRDQLDGRKGNDLLCGGDDRDTLKGGDNNDFLDGGADHDDLYGQNGDDTLEGGEGIDILIGGSGIDTLRGGNGLDGLAGNDGDDLLEGGDHLDLLSGGNGNDSLFGNGGYDALYGDNGNDALDGGADIDYCNGGSGSDTSANCELTISASTLAIEAIFAQIEAIADDGEADVEAIRQLLIDYAAQVEPEIESSNSIYLPSITN